LLATRLLSRITKIFQIQLPLSIIFEMATVAELSETINQALKSAEEHLKPAPDISRLPRISYSVETQSDGSLKLPAVLRSSASRSGGKRKYGA
jgi:hypothetical protein